jgi:hypothetical protein
MYCPTCNAEVEPDGKLDATGISDVCPVCRVELPDMCQTCLGAGEVPNLFGPIDAVPCPDCAGG